MRIALLAPLVTAIREPQAHGVATLLVDLAAGLLAAGHDVDLVAAAGSEAPGVRVVDTGVNPRDLAASWFRPLAPRSVEGARASAEAFEAAYDLIAVGSYDVVHNHAFDVPAIEGGRRLSCPVVHTLHVPYDPVVAACLQEGAECTNPPVVAAISESQRAGWAAHLSIDAVLRPGVPVGRIPWSAQAGGALLFAGRLSPEKGALEAVEIAARACRPLVVAGGHYDPDYARAVEQAAEGLDVTFTGPLPRTELWDVMATSAALVVPSAWEEPFGLVTAEAQAAGCPVVGFRRGALTEVIDDGVTGAAVEPGDEAAAVAALDHLDRFDRPACRRHAERILDVAPMIAAHLAVYERTVAGSVGGSDPRGGLSYNRPGGIA